MYENVKKNAEYTVFTKKSCTPFRILQLTDVHIGAGLFTRKKDKLALSAVEKIVKAADADFIIVTGDLVYPMWFSGGSHNNRKSAKKFADLMESLGVQWTFVFGNHDSEVWAKLSKSELADFYRSYPTCRFEKGDENITGVGNYPVIIENEDGTLNTVLMLIDSNAYLSWNFFSGFDVIHDDQIGWYKKTISDIGAAYKGKGFISDGKIPRSLAFFHIPPKEFKDAWEKLYRGDKSVTYRHGFVQEKDNYFGYPKTKKSNFFAEMVRFDSCKGMFMGHDHLNTLSLDYEGIRLTYGMSIDYLAYRGIKNKISQRGGTVIDIFDDGSFDVKMLPLSDIK